MCGVAGIVGPDAERYAGQLQRMSENIAHRGPDGNGLWTAPGVALANRRLKILDLSMAGHQPMHSDCGRYTLVYNGELYNYIEIKAELAANGEIIAGGSDTAVVLAALRRWGRDAVKRFNGMWAFALWDKQDRSLIVSRDRFGKKPLYYLSHQGRFYFSSEIKSLLTIPDFVRAPSKPAVADFAAERITDHGPGTFFQGIKQLEPAQTLVLKDGDISIATYWSLLPATSGDGKASPDQLRDMLETAVDLRLRADTPVGCTLSGGMDSGTVTCIAQQPRSGHPARHLFSSVYQPAYAEADGIDAIRALHPDTIYHPNHPTAEQFWVDVPSVVWHQEQPFGDASMVAHFGLMRLARECGVPVVLGGQGGDEIFAGYPGYLWVYLGSRLRRGEFGAFASFWRSAARHQPVALRSTLLHSLPVTLGQFTKRHLSRARLDWLAPDYRAVSSAVGHGEAELAGVDPLDHALLESISSRTLPGFLHYDDRNSMAFGVETRQPFLDYRLAEMMFRQPAGSKLAGGMVKPLLRQAMAGIVPDSILSRKDKTGYPAPLGAWLRSKPERLLDRRLIGNCPFLSPDVWQRSAKAFIAGNDAHLQATWRGFVLALWYDTFFGAGLQA